MAKSATSSKFLRPLKLGGESKPKPTAENQSNLASESGSELAREEESMPTVGNGSKPAIKGGKPNTDGGDGQSGSQLTIGHGSLPAVGNGLKSSSGRSVPQSADPEEILPIEPRKQQTPFIATTEHPRLSMLRKSRTRS